MTRDETPRMLLIEDTPGDARYIRELLREAQEFSERALDRDGDVVQSTGGTGDPAGGSLVHETRLADGLERMDDVDPDVVLLDLDLPDSTGIDTLASVVDHDEMVPVVVLTGLRDREVGVQALRQGAEEYLVKDEINPDLLIRSIYHAIERKAHERRQKRYETLIEESTDANAIVAPDGTVRYVTPSAERVLGYAPDDLAGESVLQYVHPDDRSEVRAEFEALAADADRRSSLEFRFRHDDGSWLVLHARGRNLLDEPAIEGLVVYTRDVTERRERERRLEQQRQRLGALNQLNSVVHGVTEAVIDRSTRREIEQTACDHLAASDSYEFAWVGEPDARSGTVSVRASAGADGGLDDVSVPLDPDDGTRHLAGRALQDREVRTRGGDGGPAGAPDFRSAAAVPIVHEDVVYGVLNVYADRADAFRQEERSVVGHLGEMLGHAIAAAERKRALMSDSVVELDFRINDVMDAPGAAESLDEPVALEKTIPVSDDEFLVYGVASEDEVATLESMVDGVAAWEDVNVVSEQLDGVRFELRVSDEPLMSEVASLGGSVERVVVEGTALQVTVHLPQQVEVRQALEAVHEKYSQAEVVARREVFEDEGASERLNRVWSDGLTDRQRTVAETAYFAGYFEWPRATSGEEVAESLGIAAPTFAQHLRAAQNKIFGGILDDGAGDADGTD